MCKTNSDRIELFQPNDWPELQKTLSIIILGDFFTSNTMTDFRVLSVIQLSNKTELPIILSVYVPSFSPSSTDIKILTCPVLG